MNDSSILAGDAAAQRERATAPLSQVVAAHEVPAAPSRRMVVALGALALVLGLLWLPVHLTLPLGRDPAAIGLVAERMLDGKWPFADSWDHRGPVAHALYAAMIWICGDVRLAMCVGDLLFIGVAALALRSISLSLGQPWLAAIGTLVLVLTVRDLHSYGHPDRWLAAIWLCVIAAVLHPHARRRTRTHLLVGIAIGASVMHKPTCLPLLVLPLVAAIRWHAPRDAAGVLVGFAAAVAAVVLIFDAGDRLHDLIETFVAFNFVAHAGPAGDSLALAFARFLVTAVGPWFDVGAAAITIAALLGLRALWHSDPKAGRAVALAWILGLACVLLQGKSSPHHFSFANVVVALCAAYGMSRALHWLAAAAAEDRQEFSLRLVTCGAIAIAGIALAVQSHAAQAANWWSAQFGLIPEEARDAIYCRDDRCPADIKVAADLIRRETDRATPIFLFGSDTGLYIAADRPPATRFLSSRPLVSGPQGWRNRLVSEAASALRANPPHFFVVQDFDAHRGHRRLSSRQHLEQMPELRNLISQRYDLAHNTGRFLIYRLKSATMAEAVPAGGRRG